MIEGVLFDLDGTLANTALGLGFALNQMLNKRNIPSIEISKVYDVVNQGVVGLLNLGFRINKEDKRFNNLKQEYLCEYNKCFLEQSFLFKDIDKLIIGIDKLQLKWGIVTNKSKVFTDRLVEKLKFTIDPVVVVSGDTTSESKPSVKPMLYAINKMQINPINCIYVGDSKTDIEAGKKSKMITAIANWGYFAKNENINSWGADYIIYSPLDLLNIIKELQQ